MCLNVYNKTEDGSKQTGDTCLWQLLAKAGTLLNYGRNAI